MINRRVRRVWQINLIRRWDALAESADRAFCSRKPLSSPSRICRSQTQSIPDRQLIVDVGRVRGWSSSSGLVRRA